METRRGELDENSGERQSEGVTAQHLDLELAVGYAANSALSLEIAGEFKAVDEEQF